MLSKDEFFRKSSSRECLLKMIWPIAMLIAGEFERKKEREEERKRKTRIFGHDESIRKTKAPRIRL